MNIPQAQWGKFAQVVFTAVCVGLVGFFTRWVETDNVKALLLASVPQALTVLMAVYGLPAHALQAFRGGKR